MVSQMYPMDWRVAIRRLTLSALLTNARRRLIRSGHCWWGSSMAAIAARTWAATAPTLLVWEARAVRTSCFTFALYSSGVFCHLRAASFARACSWSQAQRRSATMATIMGSADSTETHTRAVKAFLRARPAAFRRCGAVVSLTSSVESRVAYAG